MLLRICRLAKVLTILVCVLACASNAMASERVELAGDALMLGLATSAIGVAAIKHDGEGAMLFGKSLALSLGTTVGLKYTIDEERPNGKKHSFPSGHASVSFTSAEYLRKRYDWGLGLPAYAAAAFVGYSRVEADKHYWHDVFAGAAIGIASSYLFTKPFHGMNVSMIGDRTFVGIGLNRSW